MSNIKLPFRYVFMTLVEKNVWKSHTSQMSASSKQTLEHKKNMAAESFCTAAKLVCEHVVACERAGVRHPHQQAIIDVFAGTHDASVEVVDDIDLKNTGRVRVLPFLHCLSSVVQTVSRAITCYDSWLGALEHCFA